MHLHPLGRVILGSIQGGAYPIPARLARVVVGRPLRHRKFVSILPDSDSDAEAATLGSAAIDPCGCEAQCPLTVEPICLDPEGDTVTHPKTQAMARSVLCTALALALQVPGHAADASRLGGELTPAGAEKPATRTAASRPGPATRCSKAAGSSASCAATHFKYKDDKPLLSIDASNADKYADKLSPGQLAMLKQIKGYRMDIYPTRRTCGVPDFVAANTKQNVGTAKIGADGWGLIEATMPGYPFPMPENGTEAMWNAKMRYRGVGIDYKNTVTSVSPRKGGSDWIRAGQGFTAYMPWGVKGSTPLSKLPPVEYYAYFSYNSPTALAGQGLVITFFLDQPGSETFYYFPGQRRVRRMPVVRLRLAADRDGEPVHARRAVRLQRHDRPLRLEARRQEGDVRAVQQLRRVQLQGQVRGHRQARLHRSRFATLRIASRLGRRGDASSKACATTRPSAPSTSTKTAGTWSSPTTTTRRASSPRCARAS